MTIKRVYCQDSSCGFSRAPGAGRQEECDWCYGPTELREETETPPVAEPLLAIASQPTCPIAATITNATDSGGKVVSITVLLKNESSTFFEGDVYLADVHGEEGGPKRIRLAPGEERRCIPQSDRGDCDSGVVALRIRRMSSDAGFFEAELAMERPSTPGNITVTTNNQGGSDNVTVRPDQRVIVNANSVKEQQVLARDAFEFRGIKREVQFSNAAPLNRKGHRESTQSRHVLPEDPYQTERHLVNSRPPRLTIIHTETDSSACPSRTHLFSGANLFLGRALPKRKAGKSAIKSWYERPLKITDPDQPCKLEEQEDGSKKKVRNTITNQNPPVDIILSPESGQEDFTYISSYECQIELGNGRTKVKTLSANKTAFHPPQQANDEVAPECRIRFGAELKCCERFTEQDRLQLDLNRRMVPLKLGEYRQFALDQNLQTPKLSNTASSLTINRTDKIRESYVLLNPATLVGSGRHCGWRLTGEDIQPVHACIIWMDDTFWIEARSRSAVVEVADRRPLKLHQLHRLLPGETFWLGSQHFTVAETFCQHIVHCRNCEPALPPTR